MNKGGFAFLALLKMIYLFIVVIELIVGTRLLKGDKYQQTRKNTVNAMHNMMHDHDMAICCDLS